MSNNIRTIKNAVYLLSIITFLIFGQGCVEAKYNYFDAALGTILGQPSCSYDQNGFDKKCKFAD